MKSKHVAIIAGTDIWLDNSVPEKPRLWWISNMMIDADGANDNPDNDPDWQGQTSLKHKDGSYLDAYEDIFIVVNKSIINAVPEIVMGCQARVTHLDNGLKTPAAVGDLGPSAKIGEASVACAKIVKINPSPTHGGEEDKRAVLYECWPGQAATVNGIEYPLQAS